MRMPARLFLPCSVFLLMSLTLFFATVSVSAQDFLSAKLISPSELPVGAGILAAGDLNGDGISDVVYSIPPVSIPGPTSMGVAFGSPTGLHPAGVYSQAPRSVVIADVNGDGKPDIVGGLNVGPTAEVVAYLNRGDGTFTGPVTSPVVTNNSDWPSVSIGVGDFNGDGKPDVIATDQNGNFFYLRGNGDGTFVMASQFQQRGIDAYRVAEVVDLNGDGKLDLVVSQLYGATVDVLLGNGDGTFQPLISLPVYTYWPVVADFNGDGIPDIATTVIQTDGSGDLKYLLSIFAGNGNGTFRQTNSFAYGSVVGTMLAAHDIDGDGKPDLILDTANGFTVCMGLGGGQFGPPVTYSVPRWGSGGAAVGDFNGDGSLDIIGAVNYSNSTVYMLKGFGDGTFEGASTLDVNGPPTTIAAADVNGDQLTDIVAVAPGTIAFLSSLDGTFTTKTDSAGGFGDQLFVADLDGDFIPDELSVTTSPFAYNIVFRHGNGDGTFGTPVLGPTVSLPGAILGDINGDGRPDLLGTSNGSLAVRLGNGDGTFGTETDYSVTGSYVVPRVTIADLNGDGVSDVLVEVSPNGTAQTASVEVMIGKGDAAGTLNSPTGSYPAVDYTVADINGDGKLDLVTISPDPANVGLNIYLGDGTGNFGTPILVPTTQAYLNITSADLNLDGVPDVILTTSNEVGVMYGDNRGAFAPEHVLFASDVPHSIILGDWNHDGMPDLAIANHTGASPSPQSITLLLNRAGYRASLSFNANPAQYGQPLNATLSVTPSVSGSQTPGGNASLVVDGTQSFQGAINSDAYTVDLGALPVGLHNVSGTYFGDGNYKGKTLAAVPLTITKANTSIVLSSSSATILVGSTVNIGVDVQPAFSGVPTGNVTLWDGNTQVASLTLDANHTGSTSFNSLSLGDHTFTAKYTGDGNFLAGTSAVLIQQVRYPTTVALTSNSSTTLLGSNLTFVVSVQSQSGTPTGKVGLYDGTTLLGLATLANGGATFSSSTLATGTHSIKASYEGDSNFITNESNTITESISDFSFGGDKSSISVDAGASATSTLTVSALYGFTGSVALNCSGAPALATCSVSPSSVQVAGNTTTATLTITTTGPTHSAQLRDSRPSQGIRLSLALASLTIGFVGFFDAIRKQRHSFLLLCLAAVFLCGLAACGGGGSGGSSSPPPTAPATPSGSSTLLITASTAANGVTVNHQIALTLTVK